jgi:ATP-dependent helicase HrpB
VALAWPDRIARARGAPGEFLMANGRAAALEVLADQLGER